MACRTARRSPSKPAARRLLAKTAPLWTRSCSRSNNRHEKAPHRRGFSFGLFGLSQIRACLARNRIKRSVDEPGRVVFVEGPGDINIFADDDARRDVLA